MIVQPLFAPPRRNEYASTMEDAVRQISGGKRISSAADGAASLGISQVITSQAIKANVEARNLNDTISTYQETDGHLSGMSDLLFRMKELTVQARNEGLGDQQVEAIFKEFDQLLIQYSNSQTTAAAASAESVVAWRPPAAQTFGSLVWTAFEADGVIDPGNQPQYLATDGTVTVPGTTYTSGGGYTIGGRYRPLESTATATVTSSGSTAYVGVELRANQAYLFSVDVGVSSFDLLDSNGNVVFSGAGTLAAGVEISQSGTYYLRATKGSAFTNNVFSAYETSPILNTSSGDTVVDAVIAGGHYFWRSVGSELSYTGESIAPGVQGVGLNSTLNTITYSFMNTSAGGATNTGGSYSEYPSGSVIGNSADDQSGRVPFTAAQQQAVRRALDYYSSIIGVTFVEKTDGTAGNLNFANNTQVDSGGYAYYPQSIGGKTYIYMNNTATYTSAGNLVDGQYGWTALIHEIGHALGLKHPGNYNAGGGGTEPPYLPSLMDNRSYSTMSYSNPTGWGGTEASTMGWVDIAALQYLYGVADNPNQTYSFSDADVNTLKTIFSNGNGNTLNFSTTTLDLGVDLRGGSFISIGQDRNNIGVAYGTDIQTVRLGAGDADVYADSTGIDVYRYQGSLTFTGGRGADEIILSDNSTTDLDTSLGALSGYDTFWDYDQSVDKVSSGKLLAMAVSSFNGINSNLMLSHYSAEIRSHSISDDGVITFSIADAYDGAIALGSLADVAVAVEYLQANDLGDNTEVTFTALIDGVENTFLFIQGQSASNSTDYMIRLVAVADGAYETTLDSAGVSAAGQTSTAGTLGEAAMRIQSLNASRMALVGELQSTYDSIRLAFRTNRPALFNRSHGAELGSLVSILERNLNAVTAQRSVIGALSNALEAQISNLRTMFSNLQASNSQIIDTDYASATATLTRGQILNQAFASLANIQTKMNGQMIATLLA